MNENPKIKSITQPIPLAKLAYESLRNSMLAGDLKPGEIYNEMRLAKELGISKTPVREALLELASQGLVTFLPRRGVMINSFTRRDFEEAFELRKAIELAAMEKICKNIRQYDLDTLEQILQDMEETHDRYNFISFLDADRSFHGELVKMSGNRRFVAVWENIRDIIQIMGLEGLSRSGRIDEVLKEHRVVMEHLKQKQGQRAMQAMSIHLYNSMQVVLGHTERHG